MTKRKSGISPDSPVEMAPTPVANVSADSNVHALAERAADVPATQSSEEARDARLRRYGGSEYPKFNNILMNEVLNTSYRSPTDVEGNSWRQTAALAAMGAFKPKDEIEGMIAAQAVAMHLGAMECFRRAMIPEQPSDTAARLRRDGANLARGMTEMVEALDRKRGKGPQIVRVERVVVHDGGQAIVGPVTAGARQGGGGSDGNGSG